MVKFLGISLRQPQAQDAFSFLVIGALVAISVQLALSVMDIDRMVAARYAFAAIVASLCCFIGMNDKKNGWRGVAAIVCVTVVSQILFALFA